MVVLSGVAGAVVDVGAAETSGSSAADEHETTGPRGRRVAAMLRVNRARDRIVIVPVCCTAAPDARIDDQAGTGVRGHRAHPVGGEVATS